MVDCSSIELRNQLKLGSGTGMPFIYKRLSPDLLASFKPDYFDCIVDQFMIDNLYEEAK